MRISTPCLLLLSVPSFIALSGRRSQPDLPSQRSNLLRRGAEALSILFSSHCLRRIRIELIQILAALAGRFTPGLAEPVQCEGPYVEWSGAANSDGRPQWGRSFLVKLIRFLFFLDIPSGIGDHPNRSLGDRDLLKNEE